MSINRSALNRGTAYLTWNSGIFESRDAIRLKVAPAWDKVLTSMFGPVDTFKKDNLIKLTVKLWGAWENLSLIFPSYLMNPIPGTSVFGTSDLPLVIQARNADKITIVNAAVTGMSNLYLGVDSDLFSADVEFTGLLANAANPEDASAYTTRSTNAYSAATEAFAKTNYKRTRFSAAWGAITGFTAIVAQKGWNVSWAAELEPFVVDGLGTVDMTVKSMIAMAKCIPLGPTQAQLKTNSQEESAHGTLGSTISADLAITGANSGPVVTLKNAYLKDNGLVFDAVEHRIGEATWETTRGFSSGTPAVAASVA